MRRLIAIAGLLVVACGGGGTTGPTPTTGVLSGTWSGTLTLRVDGKPATTSTTTWTFSPIANTSGLGFDTQVTLRDPWLTLSTYANSTLVGQQFGSNGAYHSPRGCEGSFAFLGSGDSRRIDASVVGYECQATFEGSLILTR